MSDTEPTATDSVPQSLTEVTVASSSHPQNIYKLRSIEEKEPGRVSETQAEAEDAKVMENDEDDETSDSDSDQPSISNTVPPIEMHKEPSINPEVERLLQQLAIKRNKKPKRLHKGTKRADIFKYEITKISNKETVFALQEHVREVISNDPTNVEACIALPTDIRSSTVAYELEVMKYFLVEVGFYVVYISAECNARNCRKMQATSKFMYRCSAHKRPKDCTAIQYCIHTLDLFAERLNNKEYALPFKIPKKRAEKDMCDLCRRVYRIFAHAFFHHRHMFDDYEAEHLLCTRFIAFLKKYELVSRELFQREIQIPANSLYMNPSNRKQKIAHYFSEKIRSEERDRLALQMSKNTNMVGEGVRHSQKVSLDDFMRNINIVELESHEIY